MIDKSIYNQKQCLYLVEIKVSSGDRNITEYPLGIDRGAEQAVGDLGQRSVLVLVEVHEAALRGLHNVQIAETSLQANLHGRSLAFLSLHVCVRLARAAACEDVLVGHHLSLGVGGSQSLPSVSNDSNTDLVHNLRVFGEEMSHQQDAELLSGAELVLVGNAVHGVFASISRNDVLVVTSQESGIHDISFKKNLYAELNNVLSSIAVSGHLDEAHTVSWQ